MLEAAVAGECDFIITGDRELLQMGAFRSIRIVSPDEFLLALDDDSDDAQ